MQTDFMKCHLNWKLLSIKLIKRIWNLLFSYNGHIIWMKVHITLAFLVFFLFFNPSMVQIRLHEYSGRFCFNRNFMCLNVWALFTKPQTNRINNSILDVISCWHNRKKITKAKTFFVVIRMINRKTNDFIHSHSELKYMHVYGKCDGARYAKYTRYSNRTFWM